MMYSLPANATRRKAGECIFKNDTCAVFKPGRFRAWIDNFVVRMETNPSPENQNENTLWTNEDVAAFFRCTVRHVQNLQKYGLPYVHLGRLVRFDPEEIRNFVREHRNLKMKAVRRVRRLDMSTQTRV